MDNLPTYQIIYTESALHDIEEKADYISLQFRDPDLAESWYLRLRGELQRDLAHLPYKYPLYHVEKWSIQGVRQMTYRNDVILYSVDEEKKLVYIRACYTKGRDLAALMDHSTQ